MSWIYEYSRDTGELLAELNAMPDPMPDAANVGLVISDWRLNPAAWDPNGQQFTDWTPYQPPPEPPAPTGSPLIAFLLGQQG